MIIEGDIQHVSQQTNIPHKLFSAVWFMCDWLQHVHPEDKLKH